MLKGSRLVGVQLEVIRPGNREGRPARVQPEVIRPGNEESRLVRV